MVLGSIHPIILKQHHKHLSLQAVLFPMTVCIYIRYVTAWKKIPLTSIFFGLWSLERATKEALSFPVPFIPFADGMISACIYCLKYENPDVSSVWVTYLNNEPPIMLVSSLNEAFGLLLSNPSRLHLL